jgi:hypothetical protein
MKIENLSILCLQTAKRDIWNKNKRNFIGDDFRSGKSDELVWRETNRNFNTILFSFFSRAYLQTCFVQMRKKEPPHPIRVAKTIDVIAR